MDRIAENRDRAGMYFERVGTAQGEVYESSSGWVLRVRLRARSGEQYTFQQSVRAEGKLDAQSKLRDWIDTVALPELVQRAIAGGEVSTASTLAQWCRTDIDARAMKDNSRRTVTAALETYIEGTELGRLPVDHVTTKQVESHLRDLVTPRGPASNSTKKKILGIISRGIKQAQREGEVRGNVCDAVDGAYYLNRDMRADEPPAMTLPDFADLVEEAQASKDRRMEMMLRVVRGTGVRLGELVALRWGDIEEGTIHVERAARKNSDGVWVTEGIGGEEAAKSEAGARRIPIAPDLFHELMYYRIDQKQPPRSAYVFPGPDGGVEAPTTDGTRLKALGARVGHCERLQRCPETGRKISRYVPLGGRSHVPGWHQIRRLVASRLVESGQLSDPEIMAIMGWSSVEMLHRYYRETDASFARKAAAMAAI